MSLKFLFIEDNQPSLPQRRKLLPFLLNQISLICCVTIYLVCGGLFFGFIESQYYLQKDNERKQLITQTYRNIRLLAMDLLNEQLNENFENAYEKWRWADEKSSNYIGLNDNRTNLLDNHIELELHYLSLHLSMQKIATEKYVYKWTYATAVLYAATLVTTIGYGNISPKTILGKILTVFCKINFFSFQL